MPRFFVEPARWQVETELLGDEARHCARVMRLGAGDRIGLLDGTGRGAEAEILSTARGSVKVRMVGEWREPAPPVRLELSQAVLKGKAMELVVRKAVELGIDVIQPLACDHGAARPHEMKPGKWRRIALEACKQCGRCRMPEIREVRPLAAVGSPNRNALRFVGALWSGARPLFGLLSGTGAPTAMLEFLIGPEGDFSETERGLILEAGYRPASLGGHVLRSETAAISALAVVSAWRDEQFR